MAFRQNLLMFMQKENVKFLHFCRNGLFWQKYHLSAVIVLQKYMRHERFIACQKKGFRQKEHLLVLSVFLQKENDEDKLSLLSAERGKFSFGWL